MATFLQAPWPDLHKQKLRFAHLNLVPVVQYGFQDMAPVYQRARTAWQTVGAAIEDAKLAVVAIVAGDCEHRVLTTNRRILQHNVGRVSSDGGFALTNAVQIESAGPVEHDKDCVELLQ